MLGEKLQNGLTSLKMIYDLQSLVPASHRKEKV